jgi:hypothetical protein
MRIVLSCLLLIPLSVSPIRAQFDYPASASTRLNFVQLADGGAPAQKWTTTLAVANPDPTTAASVTFNFYNDSGQPLPLDFGQGAASTLAFSVPGGGSRLFSSTGTSSETAFVVGWARGVANIPVHGTVIYRSTTNGVPVSNVAATGTGPTYFYSSLAKDTLGVALANPSTTDTVHLHLSAKNQEGAAAGTYDVTLGPNEHMAFVLWAVMGTLPANFAGTLTITTTDTPPLSFLTWTCYERDGLLAPLPPGEMRLPASYDRRVVDSMSLVQAGASTLVRALGSALYNAAPETVVQYVRQKGIVIENNGVLAARYQSSDDTVRVSRIMTETMGGSDAALAFLIGHYVARGVLQTTGLPPSGIAATGNASTASDALSLAGMLAAGFDPGGMADFFGRFLTASSQVASDQGTLNEFGPLEQIWNRHFATWSSLIQACGNTPALGSICQKAHNYWHQHYPTGIP